MDDSNNTQDENAAPQPQEEPKQAQNFAFYTPSEAGLRETDPNKIAASPRPQPGMTFTPTGGSVSHIQHQLNQQDDDNNDPTVITPTSQQ